jgi:dipeptidyl aminopeptidase/acylaminoacyl peptidase
MTITSATEDMALSEVREIEWDTMNYPVRMRGLFILPLDYQAGIPYPLIIDIHGGGSGASLQLDGAILVSTPLEWQMWAAKGYAVFVPEFRSSGAFGGLADTRDHYEQHDLINQDIVDIETGVNKLISDGFIAPDRMAVIAHSAGARRANWLIATRHQFRAVVSKEGWADELHAVSNPIQAYPLNRVYQHFGGSPQEVPENYLKNSALHYAKDVTVPTLFLMANPELGGIDLAGTVKLFSDVIKSKNVETELIFYPDEGHVFENVSNRLDALKRSQEWIGKHTQSKK